MQFVGLLCCVMYNFHTYTSENKETKEALFNQHVNLIAADCQAKVITVPTVNALMAIYDILPKYTDSPAYTIFQQCDLSLMMSELPVQYPEMLNKLYPEDKPDTKNANKKLQQLTHLRLIQGKLAQHNQSVTYREDEASFFPDISDSYLNTTKEHRRFEAEFVGMVQGMSGAPIVQYENNMLANLLEQEICLRNNAKKPGERKIYDGQVSKSSNPQNQKTSETNTSLKTESQNQVATITGIPQEINEIPQDIAQQPTSDNQSKVSPTPTIPEQNASLDKPIDKQAEEKPNAEKPAEPQENTLFDLIFSNSKKTPIESNNDSPSAEPTTLQSDSHQKDEPRLTTPPHKKSSYKRPLFVILTLVALYYYRQAIISFLSNHYQKNFAH